MGDEGIDAPTQAQLSDAEGSVVASMATTWRHRLCWFEPNVTSVNVLVIYS